MKPTESVIRVIEYHVQRRRSLDKNSTFVTIRITPSANSANHLAIMSEEKFKQYDYRVVKKVKELKTISSVVAKEYYDKRAESKEFKDLKRVSTKNQRGKNPRVGKNPRQGTINFG